MAASSSMLNSVSGGHGLKPEPPRLYHPYNTFPSVVGRQYASAIKTTMSITFRPLRTRSAAVCDLRLAGHHHGVLGGHSHERRHPDLDSIAEFERGCFRRRHEHPQDQIEWLAHVEPRHREHALPLRLAGPKAVH